MYPANPYDNIETIVAYNYQGLGLPSILWNQFMNLVTRIDSSYNTEMTCSAEVGGHCVFDKVCDEYPYLWDFSFQL